MRFCLLILVFALPTTVRAADSLHFENDILPILARHGCNSSGCHGKAEGQGGFKLSVFASDPEADHAALTKEGRGRRTMPASPEASLLLRKGTGRAAHGGGSKIPYGGEDYRALRDWIAAGMPFGSADAPRVVALRVEPADRVMGQKAEQQLKAMLGRMALFGMTLDICEHFTWLQAYRYVVETLCREECFHPELINTQWIQHYDTADDCEACQAEIEREARPPEQL
jgi:hypothetical protein